MPSKNSTSAPLDVSANPKFDFQHNILGMADPEEFVLIGGVKLRTTPVFAAYWRFAAERQRIFFRRVNNDVGAFTNDPVLRIFKFTNAYRASDRVSQYLIRNVIYRNDLPNDARNVFFRVLLFKLFNKIETWEFLQRELVALVWENFSFSRYDKLLSKRMNEGHRIYSAAYIMPSGGTSFGHKFKHQNHLRLIENLVRANYSSRLSDCKDMAEAFALLISVPSLGPFLAYQYVTDLNYTDLTNFGEDEFVVAGPGAIDGINKCFKGLSKVKPADVIRYVWENQEKYFGKFEILFPSLWGRRLQLIDCQNLFCEISKYARVAFPEVVSVTGRTRIKQKFQVTGPLPAPWYPPKWKIDTEASL